MKTTVEMPDDLYRRAKVEAARRGTRLKDLVEQGLRLVLESSRKPQRSSGLAELMKPGQGIIESGIPDLATNPQHFANFGRDARRHR